MLTTTRARAASRAGRSRASHAATPGPWSPTLFSIPPATGFRARRRIPGPGFGGERLHDDGAERGEVEVRRKLRPVARGARRRHHRVGELDRADRRREVDSAERCSPRCPVAFLQARHAQVESSPFGDARCRGTRRLHRSHDRHPARRRGTTDVGAVGMGAPAAGRVHDELDRPVVDEGDGVAACTGPRRGVRQLADDRLDRDAA